MERRERCKSLLENRRERKKERKKERKITYAPDILKMYNVIWNEYTFCENFIPRYNFSAAINNIKTIMAKIAVHVIKITIAKYLGILILLKRFPQ